MKLKYLATLKFLKKKLNWKKIRPKWLEIVLVLFTASIVTLLVARQILCSTLVFGDNPLVTLSSGTIIGEYIFNNWHQAAYGESYPAPLAYLFLYFFNQIATYIGNINFFSFIMNFSLPLSFISFYSFSKKFCESIWLRLFGATFYIINPVVITYYNFGGFMWCLVFLPCSLSFFTDLLEKQTIRNLVKAATFTSLTMWTFPTLSPILLVVLLVMVLTYFALTKYKLVFLKKIAPQLLLLTLIILICNVPFFFAEYLYYQSPLYGFEGHSVLRDFEFTYQKVTLFNLLRLAGNVGSPQQPLGYNDPVNIRNEIGIIIPIMAFASIFWIKQPSQKKRIIIMSASVASVAIFGVILKCIVYSQLGWLIESMPILWTVRNPFKLQLMLTVCIIPLFTFSIEKIAISFIDFFKRRNLKLATLTCVLIFLGVSHIYVYNQFVFNGFMGLDKNLGDLQTYLPDKILNSMIEDSLEWYDKGSYRGIILPFDHNTELHVQLTNPLLYPGRLGLNSKVVNEIKNELEIDSNLTNLFSLLSTKYVYANYGWKETGFQIIQPKNLTRIVENLRKENLTEELHDHYSKFVVKTALPRLYVSHYPVFYSNIETIELLNHSIFYVKPVFFEMRYNGCEMNASDTALPQIFSSYSWEVPFQGIYDANVIIYSDKQEVPLYYSLDEGELDNKTITITEDAWRRISKFNLTAGTHRLWLSTNETTLFTDLNKDFKGDGSWDIKENLIKIENGKLLTSQKYDNFDLNLKFKPVEFGRESWNGPDMYFACSNSSYLRLIFHKGGYLELSKAIGGSYYEGLVVKQAKTMIGSWNHLRVIKNGEILSLYLNGEHLLTFRDSSINNKGSLGIGSDRSITYFKNVTVSKDIIAGVWLFPAEDQKDTAVTFTKTNSGRYCLQFNQTCNSGSMLFLGENYDPLWEATIDGVILTNHLKANTYANCWFTNATQGVHKIEVYYKVNLLYKHLLYMSITVVGSLLVASYFPITVLGKFRRLLSKTLSKKKPSNKA